MEWVRKFPERINMHNLLSWTFMFGNLCTVSHLIKSAREQRIIQIDNWIFVWCRDREAHWLTQSRGINYLEISGSIRHAVAITACARAAQIGLTTPHQPRWWDARSFKVLGPAKSRPVHSWPPSSRHRPEFRQPETWENNKLPWQHQHGAFR